jgi:hypothetical protein
MDWGDSQRGSWMVMRNIDSSFDISCLLLKTSHLEVNKLEAFAKKKERKKE